jgi:hypothetical protein
MAWASKASFSDFCNVLPLLGRSLASILQLEILKLKKRKESFPQHSEKQQQETQIQASSLPGSAEPWLCSTNGQISPKQ